MAENTNIYSSRLRPSTIHETMKLQISLTSMDEVNAGADLTAASV